MMRLLFLLFCQTWHFQNAEWLANGRKCVNLRKMFVCLQRNAYLCGVKQ